MDTKLFTKDGKYLMLALDHRGSFKKFIDKEAPENLTDAEVIGAKKEIIDSVEDLFSGVLVDPDWGLPAYTKKVKPYLLCLEKSGYEEVKGERETVLGYKVEDLKKLGAAGTKLLVYLNPEASNTDKQLEIAKEALEDSHKNGLPLFLEIVTYGNEEKGGSRAVWISRSLDLFLDNSVIPDVWKLEYPGGAESCREITAKVGAVPWILLTRGEPYDVFKEQLKTAIDAGAQGFLAGRAIWQEMANYTGEARKDFLQTIARNRFAEICNITLGK
ncbi:MAG TPA: DUF2090 domain-containing protein [Patescibacteria group bacterium]|nr:DUF2090 domain-containing protein [Patescibacteria group bacterium]